MVSKPSFKCFKIQKIIFSQVILKLECLFSQNIYIYILFHLILNSQSDLDSNKKKCTSSLKNMPYKLHFHQIDYNNDK